MEHDMIDCTSEALYDRFIVRMTDEQMRDYAAMCRADETVYASQESFVFGRMVLAQRALAKGGGRVMTAENRLGQITEHLKAGGFVMTVVYGGGTVYRSPEQFKVAGGSLYARRGKRWECLDFTSLKFGRRV